MHAIRQPLRYFRVRLHMLIVASNTAMCLFGEPVKIALRGASETRPSILRSINVRPQTSQVTCWSNLSTVFSFSLGPSATCTSDSHLFHFLASQETREKFLMSRLNKNRLANETFSLFCIFPLKFQFQIKFNIKSVNCWNPIKFVWNVVWSVLNATSEVSFRNCIWKESKRPLSQATGSGSRSMEHVQRKFDIKSANCWNSAKLATEVESRVLIISSKFHH
jgi:hypothetical protein